MRSSAAGRYRPELHGLRGLAIGLVVIYHVWVGRVSGGVDVFLFISAFLLTGTFWRRMDRAEPTRPIAYWARTFKRLLPPTAVVVLATLAGVRLLLPAERWMDALTDAIGSMLQVENWVLALRGVDYYAQDDAGASPFQHFWSLSIQGQVFLLWPLLMALGGLIARRTGRSPRGILAILFALVAIPSFLWSVHLTAVQQEVAYFDTRTRLWEFAAGSLLALALPSLERRRESPVGAHRAGGARIRRPLLRVLAGWIGIAGLVSCGLVLDVQGAFPGWIALWPLAAAALVLAAGTTGHRLGVDRILASGPAGLLGDISYSLYLVHWPLLVLFLAHRGEERASILEGAVLVAASLLLAWLLTRLLDAPIRRWRWASEQAWRAGAVAVVALAVGLAPAVVARQALIAQEEAAALRAVSDNPGARVLDPDFTPSPDADADAEVLPTAALVGRDWIAGDSRCTGELAPRGAEESLAASCRLVGGDPDAPVLVSVGNSRMEQFSGALIPLAEKHGWTFVALWAGGCVYAPDGDQTGDCLAYSQAVDAYLERVAPDAVALETTFLDHDGSETTIAGMEATLPRLLGAGSDVIALRDLPRLAVEPGSCLEEHGADDPACAPAIPAALAQERPDRGLLDSLGDDAGAGGDGGGLLVPIEVNDLICPDGICTPIIGTVRVSIDRDHITGTYAASMQDAVGTRLEEAGFAW
ncbi:acyltransferase family protein [Brachybacterium sp. DNPG3]